MIVGGKIKTTLCGILEECQQVIRERDRKFQVGGAPLVLQAIDRRF
ncbi:hypothetical protein MnTg03_00758 [bacterium MnTg03]|nr:hypothetical protein MnTg03_00758 [bacterium MnTg03]